MEPYHRFMKIVTAIRLTVIALTLALTACSGPVYSYRYRLTIEVETPDGLKSGSSVIETSIEDRSDTWGPPSARGLIIRTKGEAAFVDLGQGRHVIALLATGPTAQGDPDFSGPVPRVFKVRNVAEYGRLNQQKGRFPVPIDLIPTFVTFDDLNDPTTASVVRPDEFEKTFGHGTRFKHAWVEMTNDPLTDEIETKLAGIVAKLREAAKTSRIERFGDPFRVNLGHIKRGR
jgi:hypothetical protein